MFISRSTAAFSFCFVGSFLFRYVIAFRFFLSDLSDHAHIARQRDSNRRSGADFLTQKIKPAPSSGSPRHQFDWKSFFLISYQMIPH